MNMRRFEGVLAGLVIGLGTMLFTFVVDWPPLLSLRDAIGLTAIDAGTLFLVLWLLAFLVCACWTAWAGGDRRTLVAAAISWIALLLVSALFWWSTGGLQPPIALDWSLLGSFVAAVVGARAGVALAGGASGQPRGRVLRHAVAIGVAILGFASAYRVNPPFWSPAVRAALARVEIPSYPGSAITPGRSLPTTRIVDYTLGPEVDAAAVLAFYDQRLAAMGWVPSDASAHPELGPVSLARTAPGIEDRAWHDREGRLHLEVVIQPPRSEIAPEQVRMLVHCVVRPMWTIERFLELRRQIDAAR